MVGKGIPMRSPKHKSIKLSNSSMAFFSTKMCIRDRHMMIGSETEIFQSILNDDAAALGAALLMKDRIYYEIFNL